MLSAVAEVTRSLSKNLVKSGNVIVSSDNKVTIDNNEIIKKRLEFLKEQKIINVLPNEEEEKTDCSEDGFVPGIDPLKVDALLADDSEIAGKNMMLLEQADEKAENIVKEAECRAEEIRKTAHDEGYDAGYSEGMKAAEDYLNNERRKNDEVLSQKEFELNAEYDKALNELEPLLIDKLTEIYEHVLGVSLSDSTAIVLFLLKKSLSSMDSGKNYTVHVSKDDYDYVKDNKASILKVCGILPDNLAIIEDHSLKKNDCMIETDGGIFDVGLDTQLSLLKKQLKILSMES